MALLTDEELIRLQAICELLQQVGAWTHELQSSVIDLRLLEIKLKQNQSPPIEVNVHLASMTRTLFETLRYFQQLQRSGKELLRIFEEHEE